MNIFDKIFGRLGNKQKTEPNSVFKKLPTIEEFPQLNSKNRMGVIMFLGDSGKLEYFPFLKYAIRSDTDLNVKFAALKRIHLLT